MERPRTETLTSRFPAPTPATSPPQTLPSASKYTPLPPLPYRANPPTPPQRLPHPHSRFLLTSSTSPNSGRTSNGETAVQSHLASGLLLSGTDPHMTLPNTGPSSSPPPLSPWVPQAASSMYSLWQLETPQVRAASLPLTSTASSTAAMPIPSNASAATDSATFSVTKLHIYVGQHLNFRPSFPCHHSLQFLYPERGSWRGLLFYCVFSENLAPSGNWKFRVPLGWYCPTSVCTFDASPLF